MQGTIPISPRRLFLFSSPGPCDPRSRRGRVGNDGGDDRAHWVEEGLCKDL